MKYSLTYRNDQVVKDEIYYKLLEFFKDHQAFNKEQNAQNDGVQIDSPDLLGEIAEDLFKFKVEYKD